MQFTLFGPDGGLDLVMLRAVRESLRGRPRAPATRKGYAADWRSFVCWCSGVGRECLPCSQETAALYATWLLTQDGKRVSTVKRHLAAIVDSHRCARLPVPSMADAREVCEAVKRSRREQPVRKAALSVDDLVRVSRHFDTGTVLGLRNRAIVVLGFATGMRRSDLAGLQLSDVSFEKRGLAVLLRYSKTDQLGRGRLLGVWAGKRACTDPVRVLRAWLIERGTWDGPLFCRIQTGGRVTRRAIGGEAVAQVVKAAVSGVGLDPARYSGHSLRAGAATASAELGRSDQEIMGLTGHKSARVMRMYIRGARVFSGRNPLAGVL